MLPASFSLLKRPHPVYPEVSIIPKDGGARTDGHSDAATKSASVRLQTGPAEKRGEWACDSTSSALGQNRTGGQTAEGAGKNTRFRGKWLSSSQR